jgi:DNA-binding HxlR family transcriptional regulator
VGSENFDDGGQVLLGPDAGSVATGQFRAFYDAARRYGHRWTLDILGILDERPMRFTDLLRSIRPTPHAKSLRDALRRLQGQGLVVRPDEGEGARYEITPAGRQLLPVVAEFAANLRDWAQAHHAR